MIYVFSIYMMYDKSIYMFNNLLFCYHENFLKIKKHIKFQSLEILLWS